MGKYSVLAVVGLVFWATGTLAGAKEPTWRGSGGWGAGMPYGAQFDGTRLARVSGEVVRIERVIPLTGMAEGYALVLRQHDQLQTVHLGPVWFLERQDFSLELRDNVEISGSRVLLSGQPILMATALVKDGRTLQLRDDAGLPVWSSWRRTH